MAEYLLVKSYNPGTVDSIHNTLARVLGDSWLQEYHDAVFQVCDELVKNAIKSNYKFMLIWERTRRRLLGETVTISEEEVDDWLNEIFFSGESRLIETHLARLDDVPEVNRELRRLLDLENKVLTRMRNTSERRPHMDLLLMEELRPLEDIKALCARLNVYVHLRIERSPQQVLITVANDSPILEEDVHRVHHIRDRFREYCAAGKQDEFFIQSLDTSGGGHGLGYAIMDSILRDMDLEPEKTLFLISATRTMVLVALPTMRPARAQSA